MEVEKYGLDYVFKSALPRNMISIILFSFIERLDSFELIGGSQFDDEVNAVNPYEYEVKFYFRKEPIRVINDVVNWVRVMDKFVDSVRLVENIMTLQPNKESK